MSKKNLSQQITREEAKKFLPFIILQIADEDLEKLDKDYSDWRKKEEVLITMLLYPKEK